MELPSRDWARIRAASSSFFEAMSASSCEAVDTLAATFCLLGDPAAAGWMALVSSVAPLARPW